MYFSLVNPLHVVNPLEALTDCLFLFGSEVQSGFVHPFFHEVLHQIPYGGESEARGLYSVGGGQNFAPQKVCDNFWFDLIDWENHIVLQEVATELPEGLAEDRKQLIFDAVVCAPRELGGDVLPVIAVSRVQLEESEAVLGSPLAINDGRTNIVGPSLLALFGSLSVSTAGELCGDAVPDGFPPVLLNRLLEHQSQLLVFLLKSPRKSISGVCSFLITQPSQLFNRPEVAGVVYNNFDSTELCQL